jgi:hypothetical protein
MKRGAKVKLEVVKPPLTLHFSDSVGTRGISVYVTKLSEALNQGGAVQIDAEDAYMKHQLRGAAKKLGLRLVYALADGFLYVKPLVIEGDRKRLLLLLREPRTMNELHAAKFELHLPNTLTELEKQGLAHVRVKGNVEKWTLTEKGMDALPS